MPSAKPETVSGIFMKRGQETYFGDKNTFAVRYIPGYTYEKGSHYYAYCHLVLGGQIIGDPDESCYLGSWKHSLRLLKDRIKNNFSSISNTEFQNKNDREIFELIWKANQMEEDYKNEFAHLPVLNNKVWSNCSISLGETTDAYLITMTEDNGRIKFIWEGCRQPCTADKIGKLFSITVDRELVVKAIETCLDKIENEYLSYPVR